ncbi:MAG: extracellular solute-binding protein [Mariniblastus sp.]|nr:extracellular solute-binding protein [Mariniblastus sp.]
MLRVLIEKWAVNAGFLLGGLSLLLLVTGCPAPSQPDVEEDVSEDVVAPPPLSVLLVDTSGIAPLVERQWSARRDGQLQSTEISAEELRAGDYRAIEKSDVVIYPIEMIGELVKRDLIQRIPRSVWDAEEFNKKELFRKSRTRLVQFGSDPWGTPLGSPQLVLMYRRDVLEQLGESPPRTWDEFFALNRRLQEAKLQDAEGNPLPVAVDIPMADSWASVSFLAMCASDIRYRGKISTVFDIDDMNPLVNRKPFVEKLGAMQEVVDDEDLAMTPAKAYRRMMSGQSAMAIGWPATGLLDESTRDSENRNVGLARLPGSVNWYDFEAELPVRRDEDESIHVDSLGFDGRMASVSSKSGETMASFDFITWLANKQIGLLVLPESARGAPFRASHLGNAERWTGPGLSPEAVDSYVEILQSTDQSNTSFIFPRIPEAIAYRQQLDQAIQRCVADGLAPQAALDEVVEQWQAITEAEGAAQQRGWLKKSEGF